MTLPKLTLFSIKSYCIVPEESSPVFGYIIEQLFAVHGESKLNMICPMDDGAEQRYGYPFKLDWCRGLKDPSSSSTNLDQHHV